MIVTAHLSDFDTVAYPTKHPNQMERSFLKKDAKKSYLFLLGLNRKKHSWPFCLLSRFHNNYQVEDLMAHDSSLQMDFLKLFF